MASLRAYRLKAHWDRPLSGAKVIGTILVNVDGITLGIDVGTDLGSLDVSFDGSNDGKLKGLLLESSLRSTDGNNLAL